LKFDWSSRLRREKDVLTKGRSLFVLLHRLLGEVDGRQVGSVDGVVSGSGTSWLSLTGFVVEVRPAEMNLLVKRWS
jgi:hypothetical protein